MKYPHSISKSLDTVEEIVKQWPVEKPMDEVVKWVMQFDTADFEIPIRIIKNLNVIGFDDLNNGLEIAYSKLERRANNVGSKISSKNTLFATIGGAGKSGAMISYNFRLINNISNDNFLDDESVRFIKAGKIDNIVLVDDIISTGNQASEEIRRLSDLVIPLGVKKIFVLTAVGMENGIENINSNTVAEVFSAFEYTDKDTVSSLDSSFYEGVAFDRRRFLKERIQSYNNLGYGGVGGLITFYYNTPNSTIPHIWLAKNSWIPLFKRVSRINGINMFYKDLDTINNEKTKKKVSSNEITVFVEGKIEEDFLESIRLRILEALPKYKKISIISLGGFYSEKLINNIHKLSNDYLFLVEEDDTMPKRMIDRTKKILKDHPHTVIKNISYYLDLEKIKDSEVWSRRLPKNFEEMENHELFKSMRRTFFPRVIRMEGGMNSIVDEFIKEDKVIELIDSIVECVSDVEG